MTEQPIKVKAFPLGRRGVLLPTGDRRAAAQGICLYTVSRPGVLRLQRLAFELTRRVGTFAIPGRAQFWRPPVDTATWQALLADWAATVGPFDRFSLYQRRQQAREGLTLLLTNGGQPVAVIKVRQHLGPLLTEQRALAAAAASHPTTYKVPSPLGASAVRDDLAWSAQSAVFRAPHRPVLSPPAGLFVELTSALSWVPCMPNEQPAHHDLTPWNLRQDAHGTTWLFDWEDVTPAPSDADRAYFYATAHALTGGPVPPDLSPDATAYWRAIVQARPSEGADTALAARILTGLAPHHR